MKRITFLLLFSLITVLIVVIKPYQVLAAPPTNFQTTQIIGSGLDGTTGFDFSPDGRIFILQRTGEVKIYKAGQLLATNFTTLPSIPSGDRGLIGIAFDPDYANNHYVYFYYTGLDKLNRLIRFNASTDVGTDAHVLYQTTSLSEQLHVGGSIAFGPDGKLYFAIGDNGYPPNSQNLDNPHGKILRINKDGSIPADNPFYGQSGKKWEIWAYGLRNPWRFQFDKVTGRLYSADVGAGTWEEVNFIEKGKNYGWPSAEGNCTGCPYVNPVYTYIHEGDSSAVTGGPVYRGSMFPSSYVGKYFFGDYGRGFMKTLTLSADGKTGTPTDFDMQAGSVVDLKVDHDGSLYYITFYPSRLYRISYATDNHIPVANASSNITKGVPPMQVSFSSNGTFDPDGDPLTYMWDFGDGTTSTVANPLKTYQTKGTYTVQLTVSDGVSNAQARPIVIIAGEGPVMTIGAPADGTLYQAGDLINYTVHATDSAGLDISDNNLSTDIVFHHGSHIHPFIENNIGRTGSFIIPDHNHESATDVWFEIQATATDTNNISDTESINLFPNKSNMTFQTIPVGLQVTLDGSPLSTPQTVEGVEKYQRELSTPAVQAINGKYFVFESWSSAKPQKHTLITPVADTTYTAVFKEIPAPSTITLKPVADTYVSTDAKGSNFGKETILHTDANPEKISYLRFDLSSLADKTVAAATLRLRVGDNPSEGTQVLKEVAINSWSETGTTYNNRPNITGVLGSINSGDITNIWQEVDLLEYTSQNKGNLMSFAIDSTNEDSIVFLSRESTFSPELIVTTYIDSAPTPTITPTPTSILTPTPTTPNPSDSVILKPVADTHVDSTAPTNNYGATNSMQTDGYPIKISYLRFDLSSLAGQTISNAKLRLRTADNPSEGTQDLKTVIDSSWSEIGLNYNNRPTTGSTIAVLNTGDIPQVWNEIDITDNVRNSLGVSISLALESAHDDSIIFYTRESSYSPELIVNLYETGGPSSTTLIPTADSYIDIENQNTNYGGSNSLVTDGNPYKDLFMIFDSAQLAGKNILSAKLRLRVGGNPSENSQNIKEVSNSAWTESTITYLNRPVMSDTVIATLNTGDVPEIWYEIDLKNYIQSKAGQKFSIAIDSNEGDSITFYSKESLFIPEIIVQYE